MRDDKYIVEELRLREAILKKEASVNFSSFLMYINPKYEMEWFHRHIADKCQALFEGKIQNLMVFMPPQHGKLLPADTPILTTKGWKRHGDLQVGDYVFGHDGKPKAVLANSGVYDWNVERLTFQNGQTILAAREHLWKLMVDYDDHKFRREVIVETQDIFKRRHRRSPYIQCAPALDMPKRELPIDPYILGLWLGDGLSNQGVVVSGEQDIAHMGKFGKVVKEREGYYRITIPDLRKALRLCGLLDNKHIPIEYLLASKKQRTELLCGLMDTDGTCDKRGNCEFTQKSGTLAEDVYTLLRSIGYKARKAYYRAKLNGVDVGEKTRILFNPDRHDMVFKLERKAERLKNKTTEDREDKKRLFLTRIEPHGIVKGNCIQVEGGMYLAGYDMIPTHNSEIISRSFPAWVLGKNPDAKIVGTSYSSNLAEQFSRSIQRTIDSQPYHDVFPETMLNNSPFSDVKKGYLRTIEIFETINHKGYYKAVGVGGSLTGTPADIAIIDDPVKDALEAYSELQRERVWDWYNSVLSTRLHNNSRQVFVMTRWHEDDLAGRILARERDKWDVVSIPAICEKEGDDGISKRHVGDALWPDRHSLDKLLAQKARSPQQFASLYQQRPTIEGGNVVKREWFQHISRTEFNAKRWKEPINFYLDTAYDKKGARDNDPSGILAACKIKNNIYLVHAAKAYKEMPDLLRWLPTYVDTWGDRQTSMLCIEPKANGKSVIQMLKEMTDLNVKHTPSPSDSKMARICAVTPKIECGKVIIVDGDWTEDFLNELCGFPTAPHDEFVDILGYAINHLDGDTIEIPAYLDNMIR